MNKPDIDFIKGLCPAIAIEQKVITRTPRSTVGSMTEIYDYLRLLYARIGKTISPISGNKVEKADIADVLKAIEKLKNGDKILILSRFKMHSNRNMAEEANILLQKGFSRLYAQSEMIPIEDFLDSKSTPKSEIFVLIDRIVKKDFDEDDIHRISDSIQTAFYEGEGEMELRINEKATLKFSNKFELDGIRFEEPVPNLFSFNNPYGACPVCEGFSQILGLDPDLIIPDKSLSLYESAVAPWKGEKLGQWKEAFIKAAKKFNFPIHKPIMDLTPAQLSDLWNGNEYVDGIYIF